MAQAKKDKTAIWQKQADHFNEILQEAQADAADPDITPEELAEAQATVADMTANLQRLQDKHGVTPGV